MNRNLFFAALLAAAFSAKAQTTETVFSKCFCETKAVKYQLFQQSESLTVGDTTYTLDWVTRQVVENGREYKMTEVKKYQDAVEVFYDERVITFLYKKGKFWDYRLEE